MCRSLVLLWGFVWGLMEVVCFWFVFVLFCVVDGGIGVCIYWNN